MIANKELREELYLRLGQNADNFAPREKTVILSFIDTITANPTTNAPAHVENENTETELVKSVFPARPGQ